MEKKEKKKEEGDVANLEFSGRHLVHQGDLDVEEKILRHFDLSSQYGVCDTCETAPVNLELLKPVFNDLPLTGISI